MLELKNKPTDKHEILMSSLVLFSQSLHIALPYSIIIACLSSFSPLIIFTPLWPTLWGIFVMSLGILLAFIFSCALLFRLYCFTSHVPSNFFQSLKQVFTKLPNLLLLIMVYCLIVLSSVMLLIIPGVIFAFSLMFCFTLMLIDNQNILQTLIASHRLVWGHWWHCFLTMSIPLLLNIVALLACFISVTKMISHLNLSLKEAVVGLASLNVMLQSFFIPLTICVLLVLLHDLRQRKKLHVPPWN